MSVPIICSTYHVCRQTVSTWFSKWEKQGICGLVDDPGRGRRPLLSDQQKAHVVKKVLITHKLPLLEEAKCNIMKNNGYFFKPIEGKFKLDFSH